uniref:DedD protein n=1 Tax=Candidatus Kentrum sp. SD TaxID=2126332 RepID=A0A451BN26_9GAMM|nr:MAG: DedD protein [Candidatus Kentron sp. SD]VFK42204.1 MAG: DedD protein [Candidatus Kentron sp. SD]VFK79719.1 MAG: DedD protein [Candidatus Kentron sp. SD]
MEKELKYRIIGASVLVFLGVVFIPMILSPSDKMDKTFTDEVSLLENEDTSHSPVVPMGEPPLEIKSPKVPEQTGFHRETFGIQYETQSIPPIQRIKPLPEKSERKITMEGEKNAEAEFATTSTSSRLLSQDGDSSGKSERSVSRARSKVSSQQKNLAWAVQVGSFAKRKNALGLRDLLRTKGYRAFVELIQGGNIGGTRTRVFVGPVLIRENALQSAEKLRSELKIDGIVVRYSGKR